MITNKNGEFFWHERGYLPHLEQLCIQVITFRLYDSVPYDVIQQWKNSLSHTATIKNEERITKLKSMIDQYEDAGYGQCFLKDNRVAQVVEDVLRHHDGIGYRLLRWCIMPNHVHVMVELLNGTTISSLLQQWKSVSSHRANSLLARRGKFWMQEYHDRFVRDIEHYNNVLQYIDMNPVKAGLVQSPSDWRWSSAFYDGKAQ